MNRLGYTLLEVILAAILAAVILLIIATSIETQFRAFNAGRAHVEEAQLARVLLHRIGDDLRTLIPPAAATGDAASSEESDKESDEKSDEESDESESGVSDSGLADDQSREDDDEETMGESTMGGPTLGVYGELDWLRIDVVRTKRREGYSSDELPSDTAMSRAVGKIETIVYYVSTSEELAVEAVSTNSPQTGGGLVRRELLRPAAAWAAEIGMLEYRDMNIPPIAPEVTAIEFRYHDGVEWLESWDSSSSGALPKAFEIRLFFARQTTANLNPSQAAGGASAERDYLPEVQYRLIVPVMLQGEP